MENISKIAHRLSESELFESVEVYTDYENYFQRMCNLYPHWKLGTIQESIDPAEIYVLIVIDSKRGRSNTYTEKDLCTLEDLLKSGKGLK